jgi:hypothetical protein
MSPRYSKGHASVRGRTDRVWAVGENVDVSDTWLRRVVMLAIVLLVLHAVGAWTYAVLGVAAAMAAAALVAAVSIVSGRMAGRGSDVWFVVPTVVFTAVPLAARLWTLFSVEQTWWARAVEFGPFLIGFAAPVLLLLAAYLALGPQRNRAAVTPSSICVVNGSGEPAAPSLRPS